MKWRVALLAAACALTAVLGSAVASAQQPVAPPGEPCQLTGPRTLLGVQGWSLACPANDRTLRVFVSGVSDVSRVFERDAGMWLVEGAREGTASLAVTFERAAGGGVVAGVYHDADGDGTVAHAATGDRISVVESRFPVVRLHAPAGWWRRGDLINFDLDVSVDGPVPAVFGADAPGFALETLRSYQIDGRADTTISVRDKRGDGRASSDIRQSYFTASQSSAIGRTYIMQDEGGSRFRYEAGSILPYLGDTIFGTVLPFRRSLPPIQVNWSTAKVVAVGEFVPSRATDAGWFLYSLLRVGPDSPIADFENPFTFYTLSGTPDGRPDLQVRFQYFPPRDPYFPDAPGLTGTLGHASEEVRYSWDQDSNGTWDFKLNLFGQHAIEHTVQLPGLAVRTVPYQEVPTWVTSRPWDAAAFVEAPPGGDDTSEGIYVGGLDRETTNYLVGLTDNRPPTTCADIVAGYRIECSLEHGAQPELYLSAVDGRLHLVGAREGVWRGNDRLLVRYHNHDRNDHLDGWEAYEGEERTAILLDTGSVLLYQDGEGLVVGSSTAPRASFRSGPPRDAASWAALREALPAAGAVPRHGDLRRMFQSLVGTAQRFPGARIDNVRFADGEYRLAVSLPVVRDSGAPWATGLQPGEYLLRVRGAEVRADPLTAPDVAITDVVASNDTHRVLEPIALVATLRNHGRTDALTTPVRMSATRADSSGTGAAPSPPTLIAERTVDVYGEADTQVRATWAPPAPGSWLVQVIVGDTRRDVLVQVPAPPSSELPALLAAQDISPGAIGTAILALGGLTSLAAASAALICRAHQTSRVGHDA